MPEATAPKPAVGRIVHYVSHGTPLKADGIQEYSSTCRAAIITEAYYEDFNCTIVTDDVASLAVLNPTGIFPKVLNRPAVGARPRCDQTEDDGSPCPSWAIVGYDTCLAHWMPGDGPKRLHQPAYTGPYQEGRFKLDRPVQDEPAAPNARPYPAEPAIVTNPRFAGAEVAEGETPIAELVDRAIDRHHAAESTPEPETVQTPDENERPREAAPGHRNGCQGCEHEEAEIPRCWSDEDCEAWYRFLAEPPLRTISADEARTALGLPPLSETKPVLLPNPPSRRGWRRLFRRAA